MSMGGCFGCKEESVEEEGEVTATSVHLLNPRKVKDC